MICLDCDAENYFSVVNSQVLQEFCGESIWVKTPVMRCNMCGWETVGNDQVDDLRTNTADAYRKKHGLLTGEEIATLRGLLRMNQDEFARFLGVGISSVKRWETWKVQNKANDELIRAKCVPKTPLTP